MIINDFILTTYMSIKNQFKNCTLYNKLKWINILVIKSENSKTIFNLKQILIFI